MVTGPGPVSWAPTAIAAVLMVTDRLSDVKMQGSEGLIGKYTNFTNLLYLDDSISMFL